MITIGFVAFVIVRFGPSSLRCGDSMAPKELRNNSSLVIGQRENKRGLTP